MQVIPERTQRLFRDAIEHLRKLGEETDKPLCMDDFLIRANKTSSRFIVHCGFAGCAIGDCALCVPSWKAAGIHYDKYGLELSTIIKELELPPDFSYEWGALRQFFGISENAMNWLFHSEAYSDYYSPSHIAVPPGVVADRIEKFLNGETAPTLQEQHAAWSKAEYQYDAENGPED